MGISPTEETSKFRALRMREEGSETIQGADGHVEGASSPGPAARHSRCRPLTGRALGCLLSLVSERICHSKMGLVSAWPIKRGCWLGTPVLSRWTRWSGVSVSSHKRHGSNYPPHVLPPRPPPGNSCEAGASCLGCHIGLGPPRHKETEQPRDATLEGLGDAGDGTFGHSRKQRKTTVSQSLVHPYWAWRCDLPATGCHVLAHRPHYVAGGMQSRSSSSAACCCGAAPLL